ncbi:MAG: TetR/AcrR family transcriptional regulator [Actinobacteria bacterium]|nr:TetR/AcrR family transcriptional regulator [Actinomycetota bacterium]MBV9666256.1 TetR/AcrR family transcriptional regulator [Actinomycetota bacterium]
MARTPGTARAQNRAALTADIKATARRHLAEVGAPALSLRAVARDLGMVSSAVYRYFESRDALLTALIVDAFDAVGVAAEKAMEGTPNDVLVRWRAVTTAIRAWALANPHDYALVYGSPVPGYRAPEDTITPAARVSLVMLRILEDGVASQQIDTAPTSRVPRAVHADLARLRDLAAPGVPDEVLSRGLSLWTGLFGAISYELFGHFHRVIDDYDVFFDHQIRRAGTYLVTGPAADARSPA